MLHLHEICQLKKPVNLPIDQANLLYFAAEALHQARRTANCIIQASLVVVQVIMDEPLTIRDGVVRCDPLRFFNVPAAISTLHFVRP